MTARPSRRGFYLISLGVLALDQASKAAAHHFLSARGPLPVIPDFFNLWYSRNPGGLFGSFRDWDSPLRFVLLTLLPLVAVVLISAYLARTRASDRPTLFGLSLILGGAAGNLTDRLLRGEVIDFLDVYLTSSKLTDWLVATFGTAHWPTFNVADSAIVTGACLLLLGAFRPQPAAGAADRGPASAAAGFRESL